MIFDGDDDGMHHMMDGSSYMWFYMIIGIIVFFIIAVIIIYLISRISHRDKNFVKSIQDFNRVSFSEEDKSERSSFCPNCGEKLDDSEVKYCPSCGSEI